MTNSIAGDLDLPNNSIHLWLGVPPSDPVVVSAMEPELVLSATEAERWRRIVWPASRDLFAWAHISLRRVLSAYAPVDPAAWEFRLGELGRPEIVEGLQHQGLRFNLSHTEGMVAIVVNRWFDAGVDVERVGRVADIDSVARTSFSSAERSLLDTVPRTAKHELFAKLWTLKEAHLKARGLGGNVSLADFSFDPYRRNGVDFTCAEGTNVDPLDWSFAVRSVADGHVLAVACAPEDPSEPPEISRFDLGG